MNRKERRAEQAQSKRAIKKAKKAGSDMQAKMTLFGHLPENCMICQTPFDKKDRDMVMSWNVVVREEQQKVNLYCPPCWQKATNLIEEMQEGLKDND
jgi:hypothetical protein